MIWFVRASTTEYKLCCCYDVFFLCRVERCKKRNSMDDRANNNDTESSKAVRTSDSSAIEKERFTCIHCDLSFGSCAMYTIHMGYHGFHNPFICNLCGTVTENKVSFFCHIARNAHH